MPIRERLPPTPVFRNRGDFGEVPLPILSLYSIVLCVVAAVLYVAVNEHEPNRRVAFALKMFIVILVVAAIVHHWMR